MIEFWKKCFPFTLGMMLSVSFVLFMVEFIRSLDFYDMQYLLEGWPFALGAIICGLIGVPLTVAGIKRLSE